MPSMRKSVLSNLKRDDTKVPARRESANRKRRSSVENRNSFVDTLEEACKEAARLLGEYSDEEDASKCVSSATCLKSELEHEPVSDLKNGGDEQKLTLHAKLNAEMVLRDKPLS
eukprot:CAMPEP_0195538826 /NCGR_PEP_ID=MMETSP0794_2-20130614/49736_1 /TAXON_ID=515487 /ORGANISM="Stephanopyxis turris, Strain CCMP 815" /LENGTH=113 /DNA_ID=CAMNT_0040672835 /DNA_START=864 /DNA_END=1205 /DNA_ORIENTATION=-